jgi:hypothetical protein
MSVPAEFCARIQSRHGDTLGNFMSNIRVWLDRRRIDLVRFDHVSVTRGRVAFDMYFRNEQDVALFTREFGRRNVSRSQLPNGERQT